MESNDIKKALEDWIKNYDGSYVNFKILGNALDLITQQQAENENLKVENQSLRSAANSFKMHYEEAQAEIERLQQIVEDKGGLILIDNAKSEAYKECIEKVRKLAVGMHPCSDELRVFDSDLDNLLKEIEGKNSDR